MPWMYSKDLDPALTPVEREKLAEGRGIIRRVPDGVYVVSPHSIVTSYGLVTGLGITFGPNGENTYFHRTNEPDLRGTDLLNDYSDL